MRPTTCDCGECAKCRNRAYSLQWYRARPGYASERARLRRQADPEAARERDRLKYATDPVFRAKRIARSAVTRAVNAGRLTRLPCEVCGDPVTEAHHADYSRPLEVRWLCIVHHVAAHVEGAVPPLLASGGMERPVRRQRLTAAVPAPPPPSAAPARGGRPAGRKQKERGMLRLDDETFAVLNEYAEDVGKPRAVVIREAIWHLCSTA